MEDADGPSQTSLPRVAVAFEGAIEGLGARLSLAANQGDVALVKPIVAQIETLTRAQAGNVVELSSRKRGKK